jgi:hypothetical protein
MASSPVSGALSAAQIAAIQEARSIIRAQTAAQKNDLAQAPAQNPARPNPARGRGSIIDITV